MTAIGRYLKKHTESLVKDVGIEQACQITGKSKATLGRYYSDHGEHSDRYMPIETVALLEQAAKYPHVTARWQSCQARRCNMMSAVPTPSVPVA